MGLSIRLGAAAAFMCFFAASPAAADVTIEVGFSDGEIQTIRAWYREHAFDGGGHGKHKGLPPGIAKNLRRGKPLPPGIAKQALPSGLLERLPPAPGGFERVIVDGKVLLVEVATQVIHDVLADVILD